MRVSLAPAHLRSRRSARRSAASRPALAGADGARVALGGGAMRRAWRSRSRPGRRRCSARAAPVSPTPTGPLFVCDTGHHRLLIWRRAPDADDAPADLLIGQPDFFREGRNAKGEIGAATLNVPTGVSAADDVLAVADAWNHRVLIWRGYPTHRNRPADVVARSGRFSRRSRQSRRRRAPRADTLNWCYGVTIADGRLIVADTGNRRVLVWNEIPTRNGAPADLVLGQRDMTTRDENAGAGGGARGMRWPHAIAVADRPDLRRRRRQQPGDGVARLARRQRRAVRFRARSGRFLRLDHNRGVYYPTAGALNMPYGLCVRERTPDRRRHRQLPSASASTWAALRMDATRVDLAGQRDFSGKGRQPLGAGARDSLCWPYGVAALWPDAGDRRFRQQPRAPLGGLAMTLAPIARRKTRFVAMEIRVRGRVQGVGFRPTVWRIARELELVGEVLNDSEGVLVRVGGRPDAVERLRRPGGERTAAAGAHRPHRGPCLRRRAADAFPHRRESRGRRAYPGRAGRRDLRRLRSRSRRSVRAPLPLPVHQLHALRSAPQHRQRHSLRSRQHDDGAVRDVRGVRCGISRSRPIAAFTPRRSPATPAVRGRR